MNGERQAIEGLAQRVRQALCGAVAYGTRGELKTAATLAAKRGGEAAGLGCAATKLARDWGGAWASLGAGAALRYVVEQRARGKGAALRKVVGHRLGYGQAQHVHAAISCRRPGSFACPLGPNFKAELAKWWNV